ncbi:hypothetical protein NC652_023742 [Populus alba x Populus x berolinensis]|nr:hypothetical protein NC652_023742 [Populus alba x Populus x berolinensis]
MPLLCVVLSFHRIMDMVNWDWKIQVNHSFR